MMLDMLKTKADNIVLESQFIYPRTGATLVEKLCDCYKQLAETQVEIELFKTTIVKQTVFVSIQSNIEYHQIKQKLFSYANDFFCFSLPTSIIPEMPEKGSLALEILSIAGLAPNSLIRRYNSTNSWLVVERGAEKMVFASGFNYDCEQTDILLQSNEAFKQLDAVLKEENMDFSDIIRQWNYIEQITKEVSNNGSVSQHYQIFNDVRSKFYNRAQFLNGYPAATGIGIDFGGVIIDVVAVKCGNQSSIHPLKSNVQVDAYKYSKEVLAENRTMTDYSRTTPKFERAKILSTPNCKCIFVSGTAAIKGQASIPLVSVEEQTEMTIQNIFSLISPENIKNNGATINVGAELNQLRVYVKYFNDISTVKKVCQKHFPLLPIIYLVADICRQELLVEIEGLAIAE